MKDKAATKRMVGEVLGGLGFIAKGSTWRRRCADVTQVVNLQKSSFDGSFFLNIGFWIHQLGEPGPTVREEQCHVRTRASAIARDVEPSLAQLLSEDHGLEDSMRSERLRETLEKLLGALFTRTEDLNGLSQEVLSSYDWLVRTAAHETLNYMPP